MAPYLADGLCVLANLIANASKYSPKETSITVSSATREGFVRVTVADEVRPRPPPRL